MKVKTVTSHLINYVAAQSGMVVYGLAVPMLNRNLLVFQEPIGGDYIEVQPDDSKGDFAYIRLLSPNIEERPASSSERSGSCADQTVFSMECRLVAVMQCADPAELADFFRGILSGYNARSIASYIPRASVRVNRSTFIPDAAILPELPPDYEIDNWNLSVKVAAVEFTLTFHLDGCNQPAATLPC